MKKHYLRITAIKQSSGPHPASTMKAVLILLLSAMSIASAAHSAPANLQKKDTLQHLLLREDSLLNMLDESIAHLHTDASARTLPFAVQQIDGAELVRVKDANFVNALAGRVAGATINAGSAGTGGAVRVLMRGARSVFDNNGVLYVVDGIPLPQLSSQQAFDMYEGAGESGDGIGMFNPDDIESLSVLTGTAATTLYGSDAVNGVILINTKKGRSGRPVVNVSNSTTFSAALVMPEFQNRYGSAGGNYTSWGEKLAHPSGFQPADFFQTGHTIHNSVSLSLGTKQNQTFFSAATQNSRGIIPNNDVERYNISFRNTSNLLNDKLKLDLSFMYMGTGEQNMLSQGAAYNPLMPVYLFPTDNDFDALKKYETYDSSLGIPTQNWPYDWKNIRMQNPYWTANRNLFNNEKDRFLVGLGVAYDLTGWLNVAAHARYDKDNEKRTKKFYASTLGLGDNTTGLYYENEVEIRHFYADLLLNFHKSAGHFSIAATLGASIRDVKNSYDQNEGDLRQANLFALSNLDDYSKRRMSQKQPEQTKAIFMTAALGYRNTFFLNLAGRMDNTRFLGLDRDYQFYPSVGASVVLTELLPIKSDVLSMLKARFLFAKAEHRSQFYIPRFFPDKVYAYSPDLVPEQTKSYEAGLDAALFGDRLNVAFTVYKSVTSNQIMPVAVPHATDMGDYVYTNGGVVENKGIEWSLGLNQDFGPVRWNTRLVYSLNRNKVKELRFGGDSESSRVYIGEIGNFTEMLKEGGAMGDIYVYGLLADEKGDILVDEQERVSIDRRDRMFVGNANPKYTMGWANNLSWKGVELSFVLQARVGGVGVSFTEAEMNNYGVSKASATARDNGGVWVSGQQIPAANYYRPAGYALAGYQSTYSATNVRLSEASIAYNIPVNRWVNWIQGARVALVGRNLLMLYNKAPFDPEITASTGTFLQGVDYFRQPSLRNVGFSVNLRF